MHAIVFSRLTRGEHGLVGWLYAGVFGAFLKLTCYPVLHTHARPSPRLEIFSSRLGITLAEYRHVVVKVEQ